MTIHCVETSCSMCCNFAIDPKTAHVPCPHLYLGKTKGVYEGKCLISIFLYLYFEILFYFILCICLVCLLVLKVSMTIHCVETSCSMCCNFAIDPKTAHVPCPHLYLGKTKGVYEGKCLSTFDLISV